MQHPIFGGFYHMFFNLEDNALKAIAPAKYKDFMQAQGRAEQTDTSLDAFNYTGGGRHDCRDDFHAGDAAADSHPR